MHTNKKDKKELIRSAAISVIAREGFYMATTDKIAAEAGVAVGTIYNYFQSKEEILTNIFQVENKKRNDFYKILLQMNLEPPDKIRSVVEMHLTGVKNNPDLVRIILHERNSYLRICQDPYAADDGLSNFIRIVLETGIAEGKIKSCNTKIISTIIIGSVEAVINSYLKETTDDIDSAAGEIMNLIGSGLLTS